MLITVAAGITALLVVIASIQTKFHELGGSVIAGTPSDFGTLLELTVEVAIFGVGKFPDLRWAATARRFEGARSSGAVSLGKPTTQRPVQNRALRQCGAGE